MGRAGLFATSLSVAMTFAVAILGPSVMEPALPGQPGQPPWAFAAHPPPALAVALAAVALAAGTIGLGLCLRAAHRGWLAPPRAIMCAGIVAAAAIAFVPPFGSSDQLSYAAYGRMVVTGHNPYTTTPAMLARLGDPVARAVQDWRGSPSVYGGLASGGQALASLVGGTSARLTVFVLSLLNVAAFVATGLLLHRLTRGSAPRQLRAALLWTFNPLLLQVLVAGEHVDSQAIFFGVAAIAVFSLGLPNVSSHVSAPRRFLAAMAAGGIAGLGAAVKLTMVLIVAGLMVAAVAAWWRHWRWITVAVGGLVTGFAVIVAASLAPWGFASFGPALRAGSFVSIGSPWRGVRGGLGLIVDGGIAGTLVKAGAIVLAALLLVLLLRALGVPAVRNGGTGTDVDVAGVAACCVFAFVFAWLVAWLYVLPWYDGLGWAVLALLPISAPVLLIRPVLARPVLVRPALFRPVLARPVLARPALFRPVLARPVLVRPALARPALVRPALVLDWLLLARTAALAFGYLPARGITMPADLGWLRSIVRTGVTPVILLAVTVWLVVFLWRLRPRFTDLNPVNVTLSGSEPAQWHIHQPDP